MPDELWTEVHNILQEEVNKAIPKKKQSKKAEWLSEEALQIVEEQREAKIKGEREKYLQLNAESQNLAIRDTKTFFNEQWLIIEEQQKSERLEISSGKLETSSEHFTQRWAQ